MTGKGACCPATIMARLGLKPFTQHNLITHYAPAAGVASYMALSVNVSSPELFLRIFRNHDVTNNLLAGAVVGNAAYLYHRQHMAKAPTNVKILFSVYGGVFFSVGSVLLWAILCNLLPDNALTRSTAGVLSGSLFLHIAKNYLDFIDGKPSEPSESKSCAK